MRKRINWHTYFLKQAFLAAERSHDEQTQAGCVLVDPKHHIVLSTGYNGFMSNIIDTVLPTTRPGKYLWMIHAERNAILNAAKIGIRLNGSVAYLTHGPCLDCMQSLWQVGIKTAYVCRGQHAQMCTNCEYQHGLALFNQVTKNVFKIIELDIINGV